LHFLDSREIGGHNKLILKQKDRLGHRSGLWIEGFMFVQFPESKLGSSGARSRTSRSIA
jgi:hypothetical protein